MTTSIGNLKMEFTPTNTIVNYCLQGMAMEDQNKPEEAHTLFLQGWNEATSNHEKFLAAYYVSRHQQHLADRLAWLEKSLKFALTVNDPSVKSAFPHLYLAIAKCHKDLNNLDNAQKYHDLATSFNEKPSDNGPFYHGTKANLTVGDLLTPGGNSNYKPELIMNHIYFTAIVNGAGLAAALAKGNGSQRIYIVEPTGSFENDPNVTNKKFPGNPTRSYRSKLPLKIVGEVTDWARQSEEAIQQWKEKLAKNKGKIIN